MHRKRKKKDIDQSYQKTGQYLFFMGLAGIEPAANGLGNRCSIP